MIWSEKWKQPPVCHAVWQSRAWSQSLADSAGSEGAERHDGSREKSWHPQVANEQTPLQASWHVEPKHFSGLPHSSPGRCVSLIKSRSLPRPEWMGGGDPWVALRASSSSPLPARARPWAEERQRGCSEAASDSALRPEWGRSPGPLITRQTGKVI